MRLFQWMYTTWDYLQLLRFPISFLKRSIDSTSTISRFGHHHFYMRKSHGGHGVSNLLLKLMDR